MAEGDREAFARVYDALGPLVLGVIHRIVRDRSHAEEVAQECFLEAWRSARAFDPTRGSLRAWLVTMARRRAIDRIRAEGAHRRRHLASAPELAAPGADDAVVAAKEASITRQHVDGLSDVQRITIELAYFEGLTQPEIAARLGVPLGTVKTRIRDGLLTLRRRMENRT